MQGLEKILLLDSWREEWPPTWSTYITGKSKHEKKPQAHSSGDRVQTALVPSHVSTWKVARPD